MPTRIQKPTLVSLCAIALILIADVTFEFLYKTTPQYCADSCSTSYGWPLAYKTIFSGNSNYVYANWNYYNLALDGLIVALLLGIPLAIIYRILTRKNA